MKFHFIVLFVFLFFSGFAQKENLQKLSRGAWISELQLNDSTVLPFNLVIKRGLSFIIKNGELLHSLLPFGVMSQSKLSIYGTSTGIKQSILSRFYEKEKDPKKKHILRKQCGKNCTFLFCEEKF